MNKQWSLLYVNIFNDDSLCLFTCTAHKVSCVHLQAADVKAAIDDRVVGRINELVDDRIFNVGEMKRHVRLFVRTLFGDQSMPHTFNRRFSPSLDDIRNLIYCHRQRQLSGLMDQDVVLNLAGRYSVEMEDSSWIFRPSSATDAFLLDFQTAWQRRLLRLYGQDMTFLDATYRTTRYAVPLFFVCVHTNSDYIVVATLVTEHEDTKSVAEALQALSTMNPACTVNFRCNLCSELL